MLIEFRRRDFEGCKQTEGDFRSLQHFKQNETLLDLVPNIIIHKKLIQKLYISYNMRFPMCIYLIKTTRQMNLGWETSRYASL